VQKETRPWGSFSVLADYPECKVKRLEVWPGKRLSYQYHRQRSEHWYIIQGKGVVVLDGSKHELQPGEYIDIPVRARHRMINPYAEPVVFIEIQTGSYFGEDDIVRLEDDYGRE